MSKQLCATAWELETDLASLANHAAIDVDNLILGRDRVSMDGVARLSAFLAESVTEFDGPHDSPSCLNPATAVVLHLAINDSSFEHVTRLNELFARAKQITGFFDRLASNPTGFSRQHPDILKQIRLFCLALSRRAAATSNFEIVELPHSPPGTHGRYFRKYFFLTM